MDDLLREFITETNESLGVVDLELIRFEQEPHNAKILGNIFRLVHTIKGTCGFLSLSRLEALAHAAETLMDKFRSGMPASDEAVSVVLASIDRIKTILDGLAKNQTEPAGSDADLIAQLDRLARGEAAASAGAAPDLSGAQAMPDISPPAKGGAVTIEPERVAPLQESKRSVGRTIRVTVDTLEHLMTMVSELVLTRNQLLELVRQNEDSEFKAPLQRLSNVTGELQQGVMKTRMQPIGNAWQKLPRVLRDLAKDLGKEIELEMRGAETELDRQVLELIRDPLTHMVRNAADHGLETTAERRAANKADRGTIRLSAFHEGGKIVIEVADDGRGLDVARIRAKAIAQGLVTESEAAALSDAQVQKFIFMPGFTTAASVTSVSGRGVGMDVVRNNIDQIGGTIDVRSAAGAGVVFTIRIPLTLAIVSALIVEASGNRFAIPQLSVVELVRARDGSEHRIEWIKDTPLLRLRDRLLPLVDLQALLGLGDAKHTEGFIVVSQAGGQVFGIVVDAVLHTEEIVVKPMSSKLRGLPVFSGNTILGDGAVIMILDPNGIARAMGANLATENLPEPQAIEPAHLNPSTALLVFRAGSAQAKAVPLSLITRLEEIDARTIELSNGRHMLQYRGQLMPLVRMNDEVVIRGEGAQPLLVFSDNGRSMALVVDEIVDIVEDHLDIEVASVQPGVLGSAVIKGQATEIIDVGHFLPMAFADWFRRKDPAAVQRARRSVLLVEDSPFFRNMLAPVIQAAGYDVATAANGAEAMAVLKQRRVDVVVTDVDMPEMDGFQLAEAIRADSRMASVAIIALSSTVSHEAIRRGHEVGLHDYVAKFDRPGLIAALKEHADEAA